jgi:hypothetical protein
MMGPPDVILQFAHGCSFRARIAATNSSRDGIE